MARNVEHATKALAFFGASVLATSAAFAPMRVDGAGGQQDGGKSAPDKSTITADTYFDFCEENCVKAKNPWDTDGKVGFENFPSILKHRDARLVASVVGAAVGGVVNAAWDPPHKYGPNGSEEEPAWDQMLEYAKAPQKISGLLEWAVKADDRDTVIIAAVLTVLTSQTYNEREKTFGGEETSILREVAGAAYLDACELRNSRRDYIMGSLPSYFDFRIVRGNTNKYVKKVWDNQSPLGPRQTMKDVFEGTIRADLASARNHKLAGLDFMVQLGQKYSNLAAGQFALRWVDAIKKKREAGHELGGRVNGREL